MALQEQKFTVRFDKGVDGGRDPKLVIPSKFSKLDNLEWDKTSTVVQRPGFTQQTLTAHTGSPGIVNIRRLHALGEEMLLEADTGLHSLLQGKTVSRNTTNTASLAQRTLERAQVDYVDIAESQQDQSEVDAAVADPSRLECWVWVESYRNSTAKGVYYRVIDSATRTVVQSGTVHSSASDIAVSPRVVVRDRLGASTFYIYYMLTSGGSTRLKMKSLSVAISAKVPGALSAAGDATGVNVHADGIFDAHYDTRSDLVAIAWKRATNAPQLQTNAGSDGVTLQAAAAVPVAALDAVSITVVNTSTGNFALMVGHSGAGLYSYACIMTTGAATGPTALTAVLTNPGRLAVIPSPFVNNNAMVFFDFNPYVAAAVFNRDIGYLQCLGDGTTPGTASIFAKGVVLAARPTSYYGTVGGTIDVCVPTALLSDLQPTLFLLKFGDTSGSGFGNYALNDAAYTSPRVLARLFPGECGHLKTQYTAKLRMPTCLAVV